MEQNLETTRQSLISRQQVGKAWKEWLSHHSKFYMFSTEKNTYKCSDIFSSIRPWKFWIDFSRLIGNSRETSISPWKAQKWPCPSEIIILDFPANQGFQSGVTRKNSTAPRVTEMSTLLLPLLPYCLNFAAQQRWIHWQPLNLYSVGTVHCCSYFGRQHLQETNRRFPDWQSRLWRTFLYHLR